MESIFKSGRVYLRGVDVGGKDVGGKVYLRGVGRYILEE